jgi:hypothetical protein
VKLVLNRKAEQFVVRNAAPQEKGETRREFNIADAIVLVRPGSGSHRIALHTEQKLRACENGSQRHFDARIEISVCTRVLEELQRNSEILIGHGSPVRAARQSGKDRRGATIVCGCIFVCRPAYENALSTGRVACSGRLKGPANGNGVHRGLNPRMTVHVEMRVVRLALGFLQRGRLSKKSGANRVRTSLYRNADS